MYIGHVRLCINMDRYMSVNSLVYVQIEKDEITTSAHGPPWSSTSSSTCSGNFMYILGQLKKIFMHIKYIAKCPNFDLITMIIYY